MGWSHLGRCPPLSLLADVPQIAPRHALTAARHLLQVRLRKLLCILGEDLLSAPTNPDHNSSQRHEPLGSLSSPTFGGLPVRTYLNLILALPWRPSKLPPSTQFVRGIVRLCVVVRKLEGVMVVSMFHLIAAMSIGVGLPSLIVPSRAKRSECQGLTAQNP